MLLWAVQAVLAVPLPYVLVGLQYFARIMWLVVTVCMCPSSLCAGMLGSPESPGYLAAKGKRDQAVAVATKLWGAKGVAQLGESAGGWLGGWLLLGS